LDVHLDSHPAYGEDAASAVDFCLDTGKSTRVLNPTDPAASSNAIAISTAVGEV
jgi:hypothetical protein